MPKKTRKDAPPKPQTKRDMYQGITDRVIEAIEKGNVAPWYKPWFSLGGLPQNAVSKSQYRGINTFLLAMEGCLKGYEDHRWLTFKQAKDLGGNVKAGEKGTKIVFWKMLDCKDKETGEASKRPLARCYTVFNAEQCENLKLPALVKEEHEFTPIEAAERICARYKQVKVDHGGSQAGYSPLTDTIEMPAQKAFKDSESYYGTRFHEMGHSTGHPSRFNRDGIALLDVNDKHKYSKEELIAEFTASFLCAEARLSRSNEENSTAYLAYWVKTFKSDPKFLVSAAQAAQKAADYILARDLAAASTKRKDAKKTAQEATQAA